MLPFSVNYYYHSTLHSVQKPWNYLRFFLLKNLLKKVTKNLPFLSSKHSPLLALPLHLSTTVYLDYFNDIQLEPTSSTLNLQCHDNHYYIKREIRSPYPSLNVETSHLTSEQKLQYLLCPEGLESKEPVTTGTLHTSTSDYW